MEPREPVATDCHGVVPKPGDGKGALNIDTTHSFTPLHGALLYSLSHTGAALALLACPCLRSCTPQRGAQKFRSPTAPGFSEASAISPINYHLRGCYIYPLQRLTERCEKIFCFILLKITYLQKSNIFYIFLCRKYEVLFVLPNVRLNKT